MSEQDILMADNGGKNPFDASYWESRWRERQTGWDIGYASPPIIEYMRSYDNKDASILIPGCGNAYEAVFLAEQGFKNITVVDISPTAIEKAKEKAKQHLNINFICADFFSLQGSFDLILEQTFFCAIPRSLRVAYGRQSAALLAEAGRLVGVLFDREFTSDGPPFGGTASEYTDIFHTYYVFDRFESCYNSIAARKGTELFINLLKK